MQVKPVVSTLSVSPIILSVLSTKGGVGKSTHSANLSALCADSGKKTLLIDGDYAQPTASSYYTLDYEAPYGLYELLLRSVELTREHFICQTCIPNLDLIKSNDPHGQLITALMHAPDGRMRLRNVLSHPLFSEYDVIIIDTQGARTIMSEVVLLASSFTLAIVKPVVPDIREFLRGTVPILESLLPFTELGLKIPPIKVLVNGMDYTNQAKETLASFCEIIDSHAYNELNVTISMLQTLIYDLDIYKLGHRLGQPAHRLEYKTDRKSASAAQTMSDLGSELFPQWQDSFNAVLRGENE